MERESGVFSWSGSGSRAGTGVVRARKGFTLFISIEDVVDIIRITNLLEKSQVY